VCTEKLCNLEGRKGGGERGKSKEKKKKKKQGERRGFGLGRILCFEKYMVYFFTPSLSSLLSLLNIYIRKILIKIKKIITI